MGVVFLTTMAQSYSWVALLCALAPGFINFLWHCISFALHWRRNQFIDRLSESHVNCEADTLPYALSNTLQNLDFGKRTFLCNHRKRLRWTKYYIKLYKSKKLLNSLSSPRLITDCRHIAWILLCALNYKQTIDAY